MCNDQRSGSGINRIIKSSIALGAAVPVKNFHCVKHLAPGTACQAALMGVHWKVVNNPDPISQQTQRAPTAHSVGMTQVAPRLSTR